MEELKELLEKTNINYIQLVNHEADDLIASFVNQNLKNDPNTTFDIFTRDKDLLQLLNKNINILKYIDGKSALYTYENFGQEYKNMSSYLMISNAGGGGGGGHSPSATTSNTSSSFSKFSSS